MAFRMKRHGAGLASICILSTMVLVVMSSTVSLYIGSENSFKARYPRQISSSVNTHSLDQMSDENINNIKKDIDDIVKKSKLKSEKVLSSFIEEGSISFLSAKIFTVLSNTFAILKSPFLYIIYLFYRKYVL